MVAIFKSTARLMSDNRNSISRSDTGQRLINSIKSSIFDSVVSATFSSWFRFSNRFIELIFKKTGLSLMIL